MFKLGDKVVVPGHGIAVIDRITRNSNEKRFYIVKVLNSSVTLISPFDNPNFRALSNVETALEVKKILSSDIKVEMSTWNRRYREYMEKIKAGDLIEVATVLRSLEILKSQKDLSFGERKMLDLARELAHTELELIK